MQIALVNKMMAKFEDCTMTGDGFRSIFWNNLNKTYKAVGGIILFILAFISFFLEQNYTIQIGWIVLILSICIILIVSLYCVSIQLNSKYTREKSRNGISSAEIFEVLEIGGAARDQRTKAVCLIKPSKLFPEGNLVSFYYNYHEDLEHLIGIGLVTNAGEKATQIELSYSFERHKDIIDKLICKNKDVLAKTKIKPSIPEKELNELIYHMPGVPVNDAGERINQGR